MTVQVSICQGHIWHDGFTLINCKDIIYEWIQLIIKHHEQKNNLNTFPVTFHVLSCIRRLV